MSGILPRPAPGVALPPACPGPRSVRENLRLSPEERIRKLAAAVRGLDELKRAAGRPRDLEAIAELEALRDERR